LAVTLPVFRMYPLQILTVQPSLSYCRDGIFRWTTQLHHKQIAEWLFISCCRTCSDCIWLWWCL